MQVNPVEKTMKQMHEACKYVAKNPIPEGFIMMHEDYLQAVLQMTANSAFEMIAEKLEAEYDVPEFSEWIREQIRMDA